MSSVASVERSGRIFGSRKVRVGMGFLVFLTLLALAHPVLTSTVWEQAPGIYDPETGVDTNIEHPSGVSARHWLGTDPLGRDVMSMLTYSMSPALQVALLAAGLVGSLSLLAGSLAAFFRGWVDSVFTSAADSLTLIPPTIALLVAGIDQPQFGMVDAGLIFGILYGLGPAMLIIRARALSVSVKPFVDAARVAGAGPRRILSVHLLPHLIPYAGIQMMSAGIWALASVAFVQYLGATDESRIGLGSMIYTPLDVQPVLPPGFGTFNMGDFPVRIGWTSMLAAGTAIALIAVSFYLLAAGSRDAVVPERSRKFPRSEPNQIVIR